MKKKKGKRTKRSLKIPKRYSEAVNRRTDNTMTKEKGQKDKENLKGTKKVIRSRKQKKNRQYNDKRKRAKGQREA